MAKIFTIADAGGLETLVSPFSVPAFGLINGKIDVSVSSNNITVAIKGRDGNNPSTSNPVFVTINAKIRAITAALYITLNAGTNWFNSGSSELATKEIDYFPMLAWISASSEVAIGFARFPYGSVGGDFNATSTNEKYAAWKKGNNSAATVASTDDVQVIGRFAATLSASASYNWSVPTFTNANLIHYPMYETRELSWTPTLSRSSTGYTNAPTLIYANYQIIGRRCFYSTSYTQHATTPGGSGYQTVTLPFQALQNASGTGFNLSAAYALAIFVASSTLAGLRLFKYDATAEAVAASSYGAWGNYRI